MQGKLHPELCYLHGAPTPLPSCTAKRGPKVVDRARAPSHQERHLYKRLHKRCMCPPEGQ